MDTAENGFIIKAPFASAVCTCCFAKASRREGQRLQAPIGPVVLGKHAVGAQLELVAIDERGYSVQKRVVQLALDFGACIPKLVERCVESLERLVAGGGALTQLGQQVVVDTAADGARVRVAFGGCDFALVAALCNGDEVLVHQISILETAHI